jgi:SpoVK/Ycf46/Vps4 family AAA+-type ATPase
MREDIEHHTDMFFGRADLLDAYRLPRRRGFLFVGPPGNGKTLLTRHIVKRCWDKFGTQATALIPNKNTDEDDLSYAFRVASNCGPGILLLEDLDSLTTECKLTRAAFLSMIDGLHPKNGVLIIGSTNNPGDVDPALVHRPSRFDRVWHFELPAKDLREKYFKRAFESVDASLLDQLVRETDGWSFAYLNELRASAAILSVCRGSKQLEEEDVSKAHELLAVQFQAGRKNHAIPESTGDMGFRVA